MMRIELALSLILDVSKPVSPMEREALINVLESAEEYRAAKGVTDNADIERARVLINGQPGAPVAFPVPRMQDVAREVALAALRRHHGNRTHAAREVGVTPRTIRNIIRRERLEVTAGACVHDAQGNPQ